MGRGRGEEGWCAEIWGNAILAWSEVKGIGKKYKKIGSRGR